MREYIIKPSYTIKQTLKVMDALLTNTVFVENVEGLIGSVSSGDIRRALLREIELDRSVSEIMHSKPTAVSVGYSLDEVKKIFLNKKISALPVVNNKNHVIEVVLRSNVLEKHQQIYDRIQADVVIMAGGKGARLDPFTRILPKPLIPVGDKTIIETVMNEYLLFGMHNFFLSINHKREMIKAYFSGNNSQYSISYIEESIPLGTAGSLKLLPKSISKPFFVSNCDVVIKADYADFFQFHIDGEFALTLVASMQHHKISYGVCELDQAGTLKNINEKPEFNFLVNTGMYLINPDILGYIPDNCIFNMTDLIDLLKEKGLKIGVYPVSEKSWIDIGQWAEYKEGVKRLNVFLKDET